jgi:hypothetical protein
MVKIIENFPFGEQKQKLTNKYYNLEVIALNNLKKGMCTNTKRHMEHIFEIYIDNDSFLPTVGIVNAKENSIKEEYSDHHNFLFSLAEKYEKFTGEEWTLYTKK